MRISPHPNIVPLLGMLEMALSLRIVSEWMPNGNVWDYIERNPDVSRLQLVRRPESSFDLS